MATATLVERAVSATLLGVPPSTFAAGDIAVLFRTSEDNISSTVYPEGTGTWTEDNGHYVNEYARVAVSPVLSSDQARLLNGNNIQVEPRDARSLMLVKISGSAGAQGTGTISYDLAASSLTPTSAGSLVLLWFSAEEEHADDAAVPTISAPWTTLGSGDESIGDTHQDWILASRSADAESVELAVVSDTATEEDGGMTWAIAFTGADTPESHTGGSAAELGAAAIGSGLKTSTGGASATASAYSVGAGSKRSRGGSYGTASAAAEGTGHKIASGGGVASVAASTSGAGTKPSAGRAGSVATVTVTAYGQGVKFARGGHTLTLTATSAASGSKAARGGSTASTTATAAGGGSSPGAGRNITFTVTGPAGRALLAAGPTARTMRPGLPAGRTITINGPRS